MQESIFTLHRFQTGYARALVGDIADDQMTVQPAAGMNHPAWVLGHLASTAVFGSSMLGLDLATPEGWGGLFGSKSQPTPYRSDYPAKAELLEWFVKLREGLAGAVRSADPSRFDAETPHEGLRRFVPTVGDAVVFMLTTHEAIHLGQLSAWRRAMGMPPVGP